MHVSACYQFPGAKLARGNPGVQTPPGNKTRATREIFINPVRIQSTTVVDTVYPLPPDFSGLPFTVRVVVKSV